MAQCPKSESASVAKLRISKLWRADSKLWMQVTQSVLLKISIPGVSRDWGERSLILKMKALLTLKSAMNQTTAIAAVTLISLLSVVYPEIGIANFSLQAEGQNTAALVFEIKNPSKIETQSSLTIQSPVKNDPLPDLLVTYLNSYGSPLSPYAKDIVQLPNWKKDLAISYVESHMGVYCANNNCSGIGGAPGTSTWRKYTNKLEWFKDLDTLMSTPRYSEKYTTCEKMKGVYVQPGSASWVYGCEKIYSELTDLEDQAAQQKIAMQDQSGQLALATIPTGSVLLK